MTKTLATFLTATAALVLAGNLQLNAAEKKAVPSSASCVACHEKQTPQIVTDWRISRHSEVEVGCADCHGDQHQSSNDVANVKIPTPDTCAECHEQQARTGMGGDERDAYDSLAADGNDRRHEGLRRLPQGRVEVGTGD